MSLRPRHGDDDAEMMRRMYADQPVRRAVPGGGGSGNPVYRGKPDSTIAKGSSGSVSRYNANDDSDTGTNDTVYFVIGIGYAGYWVYYTQVDGRFEAIGGECP